MNKEISIADIIILVEKVGVAQAARELGVDRGTIYRRLGKNGIRRKSVLQPIVTEKQSQR